MGEGNQGGLTDELHRLGTGGVSGALQAIALQSGDREKTLTHVICNVDCPEGVKREDFVEVMNEVAETLQKVPFIKIEVPIDLRGRNYHEY